jgi:ABC-type transporter lipoprotein component MlaA
MIKKRPIARYDRSQGQQTMKPPVQPKKARDSAEVDADIAEVVATIRAQQAQIERIDLNMATLRERLAELLRERGENWSDDSGYARLLTEGVRTYYDTQNLDELILTDPLRYGWLKDYRRQTIIPQRIQVR